MLKTKQALLLVILAALIVLPAAAQVTQKKIATLGPGETIVTGETHLLLGKGPGCAMEDFFIVSQSTGGAKSRFFTYDKSGRKGPFEKITVSMLRAGADFEPPPAYFESEATTEGIEETGRNGILFRGKTYGPFQQVQGISVSADRTRFYALVAKEGKLRFISNDGRDVPAAGMAGSIMISPDGTKAIATCRGTLTMIDGVNVDMSKIDPSSFDDVYLYTIDGAKLGPYNNQDFGEVWFAAGSQNWLFDLGPTVFFNGKLLRKFGERIDKATFWIDDEKHFAWVEGEELGFWDGAKYPYPVMIRHEKSAGKTALCWISLQKNGDVVAYQRTL